MQSPRVPAAHMNTRMLVTSEAWFGGGSDLTPLLAVDRHQETPDATAFHDALSAACAPHSGADYEAFRKHCDDYFYLPHRDELRGIGGIL